MFLIKIHTLTEEEKYLVEQAKSTGYNTIGRDYDGTIGFMRGLESKGIRRWNALDVWNLRDKNLFPFVLWTDNIPVSLDSFI